MMITATRLRDFASAACAVFLASVPFEHNFEVPRLLLPVLGACALLLADGMEQTGDGAASLLRARWSRLLTLGAIFVVPPFVIGVCSLLFMSPADDASEEMGHLAERAILFLLVAPALMRRLLPHVESSLGRVLVMLPLVNGYWALASSCYGIDPEESLRLFSKEIAVHVLGFYLILNLLAANPRAIVVWTRVNLGIFATAALAALVVLLLAQAGPESWMKALEEKEWVRTDYQSPGVDLHRAQLFFDSHNRLASYLLVGLMLVPIGWSQRKSWWEIGWACLAAALIGLGILFSGTRGAVLAAAAGLALPTMMRPRTIPILLGAAVLAFFLLPKPMKIQMKTIFNPMTYTQNDGNVQLRMKAWNNTLEMIGDRPVAGFGYGWVIYEDLYPQYNEEGDDIEDKPHAHNNLLEITAETGMVGGGLFVIWQMLLLGILIVEWYRAAPGSERRGLIIAAIGIWAGLHFFGLSNYSLRRTVGVAVWMGLAFSTAIALRWAGNGSGANSPAQKT